MEDNVLASLNWGLVGGGRESQIGFSHRAAAQLGGKFKLVAGATDIDPAASVSFGLSIGLGSDRSYRCWKEMLEVERSKKPIDWILSQLLHQM